MHVNSISSNNRREIFFGYFLFIFLCFVLNSCQSPQQDEKNAMIFRICKYLWTQQSEDGGWHSSKHGILRGGQAYTPFVLLHLMEVSDDIYPKSDHKIQKALDFIRKNISKEGILGVSDHDVLEYPNYATSFALRILTRYGTEQDKQLISKMKAYLIGQQFDEERDIQPSHQAYGSWGFGETNLDGGFVGHADLSHTRRILEALREVGIKENDVYKKAKDFLGIAQNEKDGGFYYSPIIMGANKGGYSIDSVQGQTHVNSYATATADGLLALLASGYTSDSQEVKTALEWLNRNNDLEKPAGIPEDSPGQWQNVMILYHLSVRAEAYRALNIIDSSWKDKMLVVLSKKQQDDGSFFNPLGARNKENDPILGSTLALKVLLCVL